MTPKALEQLQKEAWKLSAEIWAAINPSIKCKDIYNKILPAMKEVAGRQSSSLEQFWDFAMLVRGKVIEGQRTNGEMKELAKQFIESQPIERESKDKQKEVLKEIMKGDEELGLYESKDSATDLLIKISNWHDKNYIPDWDDNHFTFLNIVKEIDEYLYPNPLCGQPSVEAGRTVAANEDDGLPQVCECDISYGVKSKGVYCPIHSPMDGEKKFWCANEPKERCKTVCTFCKSTAAAANDKWVEQTAKWAMLVSKKNNEIAELRTEIKRWEDVFHNYVDTVAYLEKEKEVLKGQQAKAIAEKAWDAAIEWYSKNMFRSDTIPDIGKAEYLSQFSSPSSPENTSAWVSAKRASPDVGEEQRQEHSDTWDAAENWVYWTINRPLNKPPNKSEYLNNLFPHIRGKRINY